MTVGHMILLACGGFLGAILRFHLSKIFNGKHPYPTGTLIVNLAGSFLIGILLGMPLSLPWKAFFISGFLGAFTTFSTLQKEVVDLWEEGQRAIAFFYLSITYVGGIALAATGYLFIK